MKHKMMRNLVILEKCLNLNDHFQKPSVQKKIFPQRMLDDTVKDEPPTLNLCMMLMSRSPNALIQFIDILIETKQNVIVDLLLNTSYKFNDD